MRAALLLGLLTACAPRVPDEDLTQPGLVARVERSQVGEDEPIELEIRAVAPPGWQVTPGSPSAEGLLLKGEGDETTQVGEAQVHTWRYALSGPKGSYVIQPGDGEADGPSDAKKPLQTAPIFVDIGVQGPSGGPMAAFQETPAEATSPWPIVAGVGAALAGLGGLALWRHLRRRKALPPPPPDPPHVVAQREWEAARLAGLDDHALALRLSSILRVYLEAITGFPATSRTTREILGAAERESLLSHDLRQRARHVLDATDRLKFAREGGGEAFFASLDEDFLAVIEATRPRPAPAPLPGGAHA